mmetsp:Transcript_103655/g.237350  ORF Transcript_103655/g.237350 Transcript_103655/m.237350 type:complete len:345 (+) Transcript_103655:38-1072(+)
MASRARRKNEDDAYLQAKEAESRGAWETAKVLFLQCVELQNSKSASAVKDYAQILNAQNRPEDAIRFLQDFQQLTAGDPTARRLLDSLKQQTVPRPAEWCRSLFVEVDPSKAGGDPLQVAQDAFPKVNVNKIASAEFCGSRLRVEFHTFSAAKKTLTTWERAGRPPPRLSWESPERLLSAGVTTVGDQYKSSTANIRSAEGDGLGSGATSSATPPTGGSGHSHSASSTASTPMIDVHPRRLFSDASPPRSPPGLTPDPIGALLCSEVCDMRARLDHIAMFHARMQPLVERTAAMQRLLSYELMREYVVNSWAYDGQVDLWQLDLYFSALGSIPEFGVGWDPSHF